MKRAAAWTLFALLIAAAAAAENWPGWRGPNGNGHSGERGLPVTWSATENVRWKTPLPGPGMSSPVVWGDRVFLTQSLDREGRRRALLCFDRKTGKQLWEGVTEYAGTESTYPGEPHYASASPVTDGERVVCSFGSAGAVCYDMRGKELWRRDLGKAEHIWGNASSPVLHGNLAILLFGPGERTFLVALDKRTGKDVWRVDEPGGQAGGDAATWIGTWSTPTLARLGGRNELLVCWPLRLQSYDPKTGAPLWSCRGLGRLVYTSPLVTPEIIVAMSGFGGPYMAVRTGGSGDVTETHRLWHFERSTQRVGSGVIVGEHVYILNENGIAQCIELKSGKTLWNERAGGRTWGSMVAAEGRLYATDQRGETLVLAAKPHFEVLSRNPLGEKSQSTPAISGGDIFIRTYGHLWCIGTPK